MKYYKSLTVNRGSWYDNGATVWPIGEAMPIINGSKGDPCGQGYHLARSPNAAVGYGKFPLTLWEAEPCGDLLGEDSDKARFSSAKIVREITKPVWVAKTEKFVASIKDVPWFRATGKRSKRWKYFETRVAAGAAARAAARAAAGDAARAAAGDAAGAAAGAAARAAAGDAAGDAAGAAAGAAVWAAVWAAAGDAAGDAAGAAARAAAGDAALMARMEICCDLKIPRKHRQHAKDRWAVWQSGYGLLCDVDGVLYVYGKP